MATVNQPNDPNSPTQPGQPVQTGGSGGAGSASGAQQAAGSATSPVQQNVNPQSAGSFNDVSAYLNANQQGGNQLGQQVAQNVTNQYNTTKTGIDTSAQSAIGSANSGYIPENTQLIQQVASNPTAAANDSGQLGAFQGQLNDTYSGPNSYTDLGTQQGNVANAQQYGNLINTPGGANVLTQQVENQLNPGQSSQGINALDTLLLTGNPNAVQTVNTAAQPYSTLTNYLDTQAGNVNNAITAGQTGAAQTSQDALNAFTGSNGTLTNLNNSINTTTAQDLSQIQAQQAAIKADIANLYGGQAINTAPTTLGTYGGTTPWGSTTNYNVGQLSSQDLAAMGMSQEQWNALQGQLQLAGTSQMMNGHNFGAGSVTGQNDLSQYLNQLDPIQSVTNATTATPEQYQQMAAIQKLLGSKTPQGNAINPMNASQAGTYNPNGYNQFDYNAALNDTTNFETQARQQAQQEANALTANADLQHAESQHEGGIGGFVKNVISHPFNNPVTQFFENPLTSVGNLQNPTATKNSMDTMNNYLAKYGPAAVGTNI